MIAIRVELADAGGPWIATRQGWASRDSWIRPFRHRALQEITFSDGSRFCVIVRERGDDGSPAPVPATMVSPRAYDDILSSASSGPVNSIVFEATSDHVQVRAGALGMAPLYLAARDAEISGSWDVAALRDHMSAFRLDERQVARMLAYQGRYCHATIFEGIFQLTERSSARFDRAGMHLSYPQAARHFLPRRIAQGADVITGFEHLLDAVTACRPVDPSRTAVHVSGGQDSANVAVTLAARFPGDLTSCAIALPGLAGVQQMRRRRALIGLGDFADVTVPAMDYLPLSPAGIRRRASLSASPMDEPYAEANEALLKALAARGADVLYTGFGGDEITGVAAREQAGRAAPVRLPPWLPPRVRDLATAPADDAPASAVPETTLMALAAMSPVLLRAGFWPVAPFADQALVRFGEWLPLEWRKEKRLMRQRLIGLGLPHEVAYPALPENFSPVMTAAIRRHAAPMLASSAENGVLADLGFVDRRALRAASERAMAEPAAADHQLYATAALECALRQVAGLPPLPEATGIRAW